MSPETKEKLDKRLHKALIQFGYPSVTIAEVEEASRKAIAGEDPGCDVVNMMVSDWLKEAGVVPKNEVKP